MFIVEIAFFIISFESLMIYLITGKYYHIHFLVFIIFPFSSVTFAI